MVPKKLYKYRPFNANTLRLLSQAETYYADPSKFNDPLDCKPVISVDTDVSTLEKVCYRVVELSVDKEAALKVIDRHRYESGQYGDYKTDQEAAAYYSRSLTGTVQVFLFTELERCGVLSLAARWNCPLMWSHYADKHHGLCIEYDMTDNRCNNLRAVDYCTTGDIKVSDIYNWKVSRSGDAERIIRKAFYYAKAKEWRYEREWRDVSSSAGPCETPIKISGVYFGLRCDVAVVTSVVKLHSGLTRKVRFFQIYRENDSFLLKRRLIDADEEEMFGVRPYLAWEFDDLSVDDPK
jgi:hypothetical protein